MHNLFDDLVRDGEAGLRELITARQQESVQLDFKCKADPTRGAPNDDDKRTLAEALSGFANSAGGLLIWGIDARKGADGVDCAQGLVPIAQIERFGSAVASLMGQLVMPRLDGVRSQIIPASAGSGSGYLLIDVDRSDRRPHRAEAKGKKAYVKRVGDSFFDMEHYDVEDAFRRLQVPQIEFDWDAERQINYGNGNFKASVLLRLRNISSQTARFPYFSISNLRGGKLFNNFGLVSPDNYRIRQERDSIHFIGDGNTVINPETSSTPAVIELDVEVKGDGTPKKIGDAPYDTLIVRFNCRFGCENSRCHVEDIELKGEDILSRIYFPRSN